MDICFEILISTNEGRKLDTIGALLLFDSYSTPNLGYYQPRVQASRSIPSNRLPSSKCKASDPVHLLVQYGVR